MSVMQAQQVVTLPSPLNQGYVWPSGAHLESLRFTHSQEKVSDCLSWVRCPWVMEMQASAPSSRDVGSGLPEKGPGGTEK